MSNSELLFTIKLKNNDAIYASVYPNYEDRMSGKYLLDVSSIYGVKNKKFFCLYNNEKLEEAVENFIHANDYLIGVNKKRNPYEFAYCKNDLTEDSELCITDCWDQDEIYDKITLIIHQVYPGWVKTYENVHSVKLRELNSNLI